LKFLIYSKCGEGAGLGLRLKEEGNDVRILIKESEYRTVYRGMIERGRPSGGGEIIIFDSSGMGSLADDLRKSGYKVFGASKFMDTLEMDRTFGLDFMRKHNIEVPRTIEFQCIDDALDFLGVEGREEYVFKPSGDLPSKLTYKPCDPEDLIRYLKFVDQSYDVEEFILQEVVDGDPLSTEYFCGPRGFVSVPTHTLEVKKFLNDNLGPSTGCSGNTVWGDVDESSDPVTALLRNCEKDLMRERYIGPIDLNVMISDKGIYGLEWTPRFGLDAMPTWLQLVRGDVGEVISGIVNGDLRKIDLLSGFASGVRITIPPYPIEPETLKVVDKSSPNYGVPIRGLDGAYYYEVYQENDEYFHSAGTGVIAVVSDVDTDIETSFSRPYDILEDAKIPDKQYRTDLGKVISEMYEQVCEKCLS
jgi:phosphoribosylamine--glycine ligase